LKTKWLTSISSALLNGVGNFFRNFSGNFSSTLEIFTWKFFNQITERKVQHEI
jgi:hypothetical protein